MESLADDCMMLMPKEEIREVCGPLIEILADGTIRLTHLSVRDFLIRPSDNLEEGDQTVKNLLVNPVEAETEIASTCVTYLSFDDFAAPVPDYNLRPTWLTTICGLALDPTFGCLTYHCKCGASHEIIYAIRPSDYLVGYMDVALYRKNWKLV